MFADSAEEIPEAVGKNMKVQMMDRNLRQETMRERGVEVENQNGDGSTT